jgi:hypothetical protein
MATCSVAYPTLTSFQGVGKIRATECALDKTAFDDRIDRSVTDYNLLGTNGGDELAFSLPFEIRSSWPKP